MSKDFMIHIKNKEVFIYEEIEVYNFYDYNDLYNEYGI